MLNKTLQITSMKNIYEKDIIDRGIRIPETEQISIITGPRRSGKTYTLYKKAKELKPTDILFLDFDDERLVMLNTLKSYDIILDSYKNLFGENKPIIFLDEIQSLKNWHLFLKRLYATGYKIYATGSNSNLLSKEISTYLSGRSIETHVLPFSFKEFLKLKKIAFSENDIYTEASKVLKLFDEYLIHGGFPEVIKSEDKTISAKSIYELLFYKDLIAKFDFSEYALKLIINKLCENIGNSFSLTKFSEKIYPLYNISKPTTIEYINALAMPFLIEPVFLYKKSFSARQSERKVYFIDNSFITINNIEPDKNKLMENMVFIELKRRGFYIHYYRTAKGYEVDFFAVKDKEKHLIQVCYSITDHETKKREIRALLDAAKEINDKDLQLSILTYNDEYFVTEDRITVMSVFRWLYAT